MQAFQVESDAANYYQNLTKSQVHFIMTTQETKSKKECPAIIFKFSLGEAFVFKVILICIRGQIRLLNSLLKHIAASVDGKNLAAGELWGKNR